ncbi:uncharacterized protein LOC135388363 isoform X2 [Ornithodoros turicata]
MMKLIRWVEVHIGRSRKKAKKTPTKTQNPPASTTVIASPDLNTTTRDEAKQTPHHDYDELVFEATRSPRTPESSSRKAPPHIRTSFLDQVSPADVSSPRQRSRIKTNPWLPSPRSPCGSTSADSGWTGSRSSTGSEGSEPGDAASDASSYHNWTSMSSLRNSRETIPSPWASLKPRTSTLEPYRRPLPSISSSASDGFLRRRHPESARVYRRDFDTYRKGITHISDDSCSSDDEAYSEDFVQSEDSDVASVLKGQKVLVSPQTDSACDSAGSCMTTPMSETNTCSAMHKESLGDKVQRLRAERVVVEQKIREARVEEQIRREERIMLHQEMVQFRRLLLLKTLQGLRVDLDERSHGREVCTTTMQTRAEWRLERRKL